MPHIKSGHRCQRSNFLFLWNVYVYVSTPKASLLSTSAIDSICVLFAHFFARTNLFSCMIELTFSRARAPAWVFLPLSLYLCTGGLGGVTTLSVAKLASKSIKSKANPITGSVDPYGCETPRLPHFLDNRLTNSGKVVSLTRRLAALSPRKIPGSHFS
jgi:hypothetical protein